MEIPVAIFVCPVFEKSAKRWCICDILFCCFVIYFHCTIGGKIMLTSSACVDLTQFFLRKEFSNIKTPDLWDECAEHPGMSIIFWPRIFWPLEPVHCFAEKRFSFMIHSSCPMRSFGRQSTCLRMDKLPPNFLLSLEVTYFAKKSGWQSTWYSHMWVPFDSSHSIAQDPAINLFPLSSNSSSYRLASSAGSCTQRWVYCSYSKYLLMNSFQSATLSGFSWRSLKYTFFCMSKLNPRFFSQWNPDFVSTVERFSDHTNSCFNIGFSPLSSSFMYCAYTLSTSVVQIKEAVVLLFSFSRFWFAQCQSSSRASGKRLKSFGWTSFSISTKGFGCGSRPAIQKYECHAWMVRKDGSFVTSSWHKVSILCLQQAIQFLAGISSSATW